MNAYRHRTRTFQHEVARWRQVAASDAPPAGTRWFWTGTVFTGYRGTCSWRISLICSSRSQAGETGLTHIESLVISHKIKGNSHHVQQLVVSVPVAPESQSCSGWQGDSSRSHLSRQMLAGDFIAKRLKIHSHSGCSSSHWIENLWEITHFTDKDPDNVDGKTNK